MTDKVIVSVSPHIKAGVATRDIMKDVLIALLPAALFGVIAFGFNALFLIGCSIGMAVFSEWLFAKIFKRTATLNDLSAVVTGLLLALSVSPAVSWWAVLLGAFIAIFVAKMLFGGLGYNIFNPALVGRAFLMASFPVMMTTWPKPFDAVTGATPLAVLKDDPTAVLPSLWALFFGNVGGCIGETSAFLLLLGAGYLFYKKVIDWRISGAYFFIVIIFSLSLGLPVFYHLLAGGLLLGAFFMATDYTTSPMATKGKLLFGAGCGLLTMIIRVYGGYPEGVSYAILIMNMFVPLIDRLNYRFK